jgi:hypothetical protein
MMKCIYYLSPNLVSTRSISDDLHDVGVDDWFLHVVSKDEAGLRKEKIHSSNYLETLDLVRCGFIGANIGFIVGMISAGLIMFFEPFGPDMPGFIYFLVGGFFTLFGAWEGGLFGVAKENSKLERFHEDIESGKNLVLIYARRNTGDTIHAMMSAKHPEAKHVATDRHFVSPFSVVRRKRHSWSGRDGQRDQLAS